MLTRDNMHSFIFLENPVTFRLLNSLGVGTRLEYEDCMEFKYWYVKGSALCGTDNIHDRIKHLTLFHLKPVTTRRTRCNTK